MYGRNILTDSLYTPRSTPLTDELDATSPSYSTLLYSRSMELCSFGKVKPFDGISCGTSKSKRFKDKYDRSTNYPLRMLDGQLEKSERNPDNLTESQLILYRKGFFDTNEDTHKHDFSKFNVCPQHRKRLGNLFKYDEPFCFLRKGKEAYHKELQTIISRKVVDLAIAEAVYKEYQYVVPIGAGKFIGQRRMFLLSLKRQHYQ